jgi:hypothetical protein
VTSNLNALHTTALEQFRFVAQAEVEQRRSEMAALLFESGDQWPEDAKASRAGVPADLGMRQPAVPARPMLTMRTLDQPLAQISSMERAADLSIKIVPKDGKANKKTGEVFQGLCRSIEADSHAAEAYQWGFQRMRSCGRGYWRVNKTYASEAGGFDQVLRIEPIENGASVYLDPMPRWQSGGGFWEPEFGFITEDLSAAAYKRRYGASKLATATDSELLTGIGDETRGDWIIEGEAGKYYRTAEYFYATYETTTETDESDTTLTREIRTRTIMWAKMNGMEFLDPPQEWDGRYIPIIPDTGNKFNVGGRKMYEGMVQPNISPCRMLNYMVSAAAEKIGLATLSPWLGVAGQFEGFEGFWDQANTRNFSKLEYNAVTPSTGPQLLPPPTRNNDEPAIHAFAEMIGLFTNFIRSTTGVPDAALGHVNPNDKSGRAIMELKRASEQGASNWLAYHARAIRHTGCVLVDLIPHVYDRPGRVERILGIDGTPQSVMLNAPFTRDREGEPVAAPGGMPSAQPGAMPGGPAPGPTPMGPMARPAPVIEQHSLTAGQYSVVVDVGKNQETRRQDTQMGMGLLAQAVPQLVPQFADLWVASMDIPEADAIADRIKPPGIDGPDALPPEVQAQLSQLQQALQEATQLADEQKTKLTIAASADATKIRIAEIQAQTSITTAEIKAGMADMANQIQVLSTLIGTDQQERLSEREGAETLEQADRDQAQVSQQQQHEREMAELAQQQTLEQGDQAHQQALEQDAQPAPLDPNAEMGAE